MDTVFKPKNRVLVDKGASNEDEGFVYMTGPTHAAVCNLDGDRYIVSKTRLTHTTDGTKILPESTVTS